MEAKTHRIKHQSHFDGSGLVYSGVEFCFQKSSLATLYAAHQDPCKPSEPKVLSLAKDHP